LTHWVTIQSALTLSAAAARVQADALQAAEARDPVSTADLIEVIVRAVGSLHLQRIEELQVTRARLIAAVAHSSAPRSRSRPPFA